jgi:nucleotide-binding universal stress UspA family protein
VAGRHAARPPGWLGPGLVAAIVLGAGGALVLARPPRRRRLGLPTRASGQGAHAVEAALDELERVSDPRAAVIAAYAAMRRSLAEGGVAPGPAEAPREYLGRALARAPAARAALRRLTASFEVARFSGHPIGETERRRAREELEAIRAALTA